MHIAGCPTRDRSVKIKNRLDTKIIQMRAIWVVSRLPLLTRYVMPPQQWADPDFTPKSKGLLRSETDDSQARVFYTGARQEPCINPGSFVVRVCVLLRGLIGIDVFIYVQHT